jgi:hypothetical protein
MQKPMTPTLPVQSGSARSRMRQDSISSNGLPTRARYARKVLTMHRSHGPSPSRSGAYTRYPAEAKRSA